MKMITIWRIMIAGTRNFFRNAWLSTAATAVMAVTLMIILVSVIANNAITSTIRDIVNKVHVSVYLKDTVTAEQTNELQNKLSEHENVASVRYVSKADALAKYKQQNRNNPKLLEAITEAENPLPASLEVKAKDPKRIDPIVDYIKQSQYNAWVSEYSYAAERKATIDRIVRVSNFLKTAGLTASIVFTIISILIIFNTIRMAIFTRRNEIEIMKLVGATNWFIRGPFIFEAAMYGIIASFVAVGICYLGLIAGGGWLKSYIDVATALSTFQDSPGLILLGQMAIGIFIGALSSLLAMMRYLKL